MLLEIWQVPPNWNVGLKQCVSFSHQQLSQFHNVHGKQLGYSFKSNLKSWSKSGEKKRKWGQLWKEQLHWWHQTNKIPIPVPDRNCIYIKEVIWKSRKKQQYCERLVLNPAVTRARSPISAPPKTPLAAAKQPTNGQMLPLKKKKEMRICSTSLPESPLFFSSYHIYKGRKRYHGNTLPGNLGGLAWCPIVARALLSMAVGEWANVCVCESTSCNYLCMGENMCAF